MPSNTTAACVRCRRYKKRCSDSVPCRTCVGAGAACQSVPAKRRTWPAPVMPYRSGESTLQTAGAQLYVNKRARRMSFTHSSQSGSSERGSARNDSHSPVAREWLLPPFAELMGGLSLPDRPDEDPHSNCMAVASHQSPDYMRISDILNQPTASKVPQQGLSDVMRQCARDRGMGYRLPDHLLRRDPVTGQTLLSADAINDPTFSALAPDLTQSPYSGNRAKTIDRTLSSGGQQQSIESVQAYALSLDNQGSRDLFSTNNAVIRQQECSLAARPHSIRGVR